LECDGTRMIRIHFVKARIFLFIEKKKTFVEGLYIIERNQWHADDTDLLRKNADWRGFFLLAPSLSDWASQWHADHTDLLRENTH
jgi:hypothetical protein